MRGEGRPRVPDTTSEGALEHVRRHRAAARLRAEGAAAGGSAAAPMAAGFEPRAGPARGLPRGRRSLETGASTHLNFKTNNGLKLTYRRMGSGPVLVCHPGGPGFSSTELGDLAGLW